VTGTTALSIYLLAGGRPGVLASASELLRPPPLITGRVPVELSAGSSRPPASRYPGNGKVTTKAGTGGVADPTLTSVPVREFPGHGQAGSKQRDRA
jgi:hypothetical protein